MVFLSGTLLARPTFATVDFNVSLDPVLQVIIPADTILLDLTPTASGADFTSSDLNVAIGTNNPTGYHFSLHTNSTNLTKTEADNYGNYAILPTLEDNGIGYNETDFTVNRWGYLVNNLTKGEDSELYLPFETDIELSATTGPVDIEEFGFRFGAKVDMEQPAGTYVLALNFNAVANVVPGVVTITFDPNTGTGQMPVQQIESGTSQNLNPNTFTKENYIFMGWNTKPDGTGTHYDNEQSYETVLDVLNKSVTLYAQWWDGKMQSVTANICSETPLTALDNRDNTEYLIAKLADGNCWMIQNLKLGAKADSYALTTANSDTNGDFTLNGKSPDGIFTNAQSNGVNYTNDSSQFYCTEDYGCYYNWYTATAGSGTSLISTQGQSVTTSICPKGWTLPTGGAGGQFEALTAAYNNSVTSMLVNPTTLTENTNGDKPGLLLGGYYYTSGAGYVGTRGGYWSRTADSGQLGYLFSTDNPTYGGHKYVGRSVRCVLNTRTISDITYMQDVTPTIVANTAEGATATLTDKRDNNTYTVAKINGNLWMTQNLAFAGTTLTAADSNVTTTRTISWGRLTSGNDFSEPRMTASSTYGAWYNYAGATAGTITGDSNETEASESICPKGWRLPTHAEAQTIGTGNNTYVSAFSPVTGGNYYSGSLHNTSYGYWWSSTASSTTYRHFLYCLGSRLGTGGSGRDSGFYVRCISSS